MSENSIYTQKSRIGTVRVTRLGNYRRSKFQSKRCTLFKNLELKINK